MKVKNTFKNMLPILLCFLTLLHPSLGDTPLEKKMDQMKKAYKELSKSLENPNEKEKAKYEKLAIKLRDLMKDSEKLSPEKTNTIPAEKRAAFIAGYQQAIQQSVTTLNSLILAIQSSQWTEAKQLISTLKSQQKEGHKEYRSEHP